MKRFKTLSFRTYDMFRRWYLNIKQRFSELVVTWFKQDQVHNRLYVTISY